MILLPLRKTALAALFSRPLPVAFIAGLILWFGSAVGLADDTRVRVMTLNMYEGTDLKAITQALIAGTPIDPVIDATLLDIEKTRPDARVAAMANEIVARNVDLVALHEATLVETRIPFGTPPAPGNWMQKWDLLKLLLAELNKYGHAYYLVPDPVTRMSPVIGLDAAVPFSDPKVRFQRRTAIIARARFACDNYTAGVFTAAFSFSIPAMKISVPVHRAWAACLATVGGRTFRFVTTHLDGDDAKVRFSQAQELVQRLADPRLGNTNLPVVLVGDFNIGISFVESLNTELFPNATDQATYDLLKANFFYDVWTQPAQFPHARMGSTCCRNIADPLSSLALASSTRIDLVFFRGAFRVNNAQVVDWAVNRPWPSDHAAVFSELEILPY